MLKRCLYPVVRIVPTLVLICFVFSVEANAGNPVAAVPWETNFFGSGGKELLADANAVATPEKGDVLVLLDEATYSFDAEGRCSSRYRLVYRILNQAGIEDWASIEAGWAPWYQERPRLRARVITPDGAEHLLLPQSIADSPLKTPPPMSLVTAGWFVHLCLHWPLAQLWSRRSSPMRKLPLSRREASTGSTSAGLRRPSKHG